MIEDASRMEAEAHRIQENARLKEEVQVVVEGTRRKAPIAIFSDVDEDIRQELEEEAAGIAEDGADLVASPERRRRGRAILARRLCSKFSHGRHGV